MPAKRHPYLICLEEPEADVLEAIQAEWSEEHRVDLTDTQILVAFRNEGTSVYDLIQNRLEGKLFDALVLRIERKGFHGYKPRSLWEWLARRFSE